MADSVPVLIQHKVPGSREPPAAERRLVAVPRTCFAAVRAAPESLLEGAQARLEHLLVLDAEGAMTGHGAILATLVQPLHPPQRRRRGWCLISIGRHPGYWWLWPTGPAANID